MCPAVLMTNIPGAGSGGTTGLVFRRVAEWPDDNTDDGGLGVLQVGDDAPAGRAGSGRDAGRSGAGRADLNGAGAQDGRDLDVS